MTYTRDRDDYYEYLCSRSGLEGSHQFLLDILNEIPFSSPIRMDENRAADGIELRQNYYQDNHIRMPRQEEPSRKPCTFLEFLIAFAAKSYELTSYFRSEQWILQWFIENIDVRLITDYDDQSIMAYSDEHISYQNRSNLHKIFAYDSICKSVKQCQERNYEYGKLGGDGCLFRYKNRRELPGDLRTMEYWKQLQYWALELPISEE